MPYTNLTINIAMQLEYYIEDKWTQSKNDSCFNVKKQVFARGGHLALTPVSIITTVADSAIGVVAGVAAMATLGKHKKTLTFARAHLTSSKMIISEPYFHLLKTLNPKAEVAKSTAGFISGYVKGYLKNKATTCYKSKNWFMRHITTRLTYVVLAIASVITRIIDGIIGVIAATLSFLTLGKITSINNLAYGALQAPGIINDLFGCAIKVINPQAGEKKQTNDSRRAEED